MNSGLRLLRMRARHWRWRPAFTATLLAFSFSVGLTGSIRWLQHQPEAPPPVDIGSLLNPVIHLEGCSCRDDSENLQAALDSASPGTTVALSGEFTTTEPMVLRGHNITIDGQGKSRITTSAPRVLWFTQNAREITIRDNYFSAR